MPAYSKGTRSKGVTRQFNSAAQVGNQQKSKKARVDAYLNKEAFMKEALARHMAVEEARVQAAREAALVLFNTLQKKHGELEQERARKDEKIMQLRAYSNTLCSYIVLEVTGVGVARRPTWTSLLSTVQVRR